MNEPQQKSVSKNHHQEIEIFMQDIPSKLDNKLDILKKKVFTINYANKHIKFLRVCFAQPDINTGVDLKKIP